MTTALCVCVPVCVCVCMCVYTQAAQPTKRTSDPLRAWRETSHAMASPHTGPNGAPLPPGEEKLIQDRENLEQLRDALSTASRAVRVCVCACECLPQLAFKLVQELSWAVPCTPVCVCVCVCVCVKSTQCVSFAVGDNSAGSAVCVCVCAQAEKLVHRMDRCSSVSGDAGLSLFKLSKFEEAEGPHLAQYTGTVRVTHIHTHTHTHTQTLHFHQSQVPACREGSDHFLKHTVPVSMSQLYVCLCVYVCVCVHRCVRPSP